MEEKIVINSTGTVSAQPVDSLSDTELLKKAMGNLTLEEFIQSDAFAKAVNTVAKRNKMTPVDVAQGFVGGLLGATSDTLVTGVTTLEQFIDNLLDTAHGTLKAVNHTAADLGKGVVRTVTFNKGTK